MGDAKSAQERLDAESAMDLSSELKVGQTYHNPLHRDGIFEHLGTFPMWAHATALQQREQQQHRHLSRHTRIHLAVWRRWERGKDAAPGRFRGNNSTVKEPFPTMDDLSSGVYLLCALDKPMHLSARVCDYHRGHAPRTLTRSTTEKR